MTDIFLNSDDIIRGSPIGHEAGLARAYDLFQEGFQPTGNDFGYKFILSVEKTNESKILKGGGIPTLRYESNIGRVHLGAHRAGT